MQAKDIPDNEFLGIVATEGAKNVAGWVQSWQLQEHWPDVPRKVLIAKARQLIKRRLLGGCGCGCRGDFHIPLPCCGGGYGIHYSACPENNLS